jgi:hypothetical protein
MNITQQTLINSITHEVNEEVITDLVNYGFDRDEAIKLVNEFDSSNSFISEVSAF